MTVNSGESFREGVQDAGPSHQVRLTVRLKLGKGLKGWLRMKRTEIRERRRENSVHKWMG